MRKIALARRAAELGQTENACAAYSFALEQQESDPLTPLERMEAAVYLLQSEGDYHTAYDALLRLYEDDCYRRDVLSVLVNAFYTPNVEELSARYARNLDLLEAYPYLFRKDFPAFEELRLLFFPYDDGVYVPFDTERGEFLPKVAPGEQVIRRWFFRDLSKPVLAENVFSQYELEYLADNVRSSEDVGYENHVYLHYSEWDCFCAWLQVLDFQPLLKRNKTVFLIGAEREQYPIDFRERFGVDYSRETPEPLHVRDITRVIWHAQLSTHNGGDLFNEVFDMHPNLLFFSSIMMDEFLSFTDVFRSGIEVAPSLDDAKEVLGQLLNPRIVEELYLMEQPTEKDLLVAFYLGSKVLSNGSDLDFSDRDILAPLDAASRIFPAVFFQPHFGNPATVFEVQPDGRTVMEWEGVEEIVQSRLLEGFRYIKTFSPVRRFTTSYGGSLRFMVASGKANLAKAEKARAETPEEIEPNTTLLVFKDMISERVRTRTFMRDPDCYLFRDCAVVRFEDAKLNPEATFSALSGFLDLPYTETMTRCTINGVAVGEGFDPKPVYRTYDDYMNQAERCYIEYFLRDAYRFYGYDFQYWDGTEPSDETICSWVDGCTEMERVGWEIQKLCFQLWEVNNGMRISEQLDPDQYWEEKLQTFRKVRLQTASALRAGLTYINRNGRRLEMQPLLKPDPKLLSQPLYH